MNWSELYLYVILTFTLFRLFTNCWPKAVVYTTVFFSGRRKNNIPYLFSQENIRTHSRISKHSENIRWNKELQLKLLVTVLKEFVSNKFTIVKTWSTLCYKCRWIWKLNMWRKWMQCILAPMYSHQIWPANLLWEYENVRGCGPWVTWPGTCAVSFFGF